MHAPPAPSPDFAAELLRGHLANDEQGLVQIETAADRVLAETGLRFESDPETLDLWRENGATIRDERVTLDGAWLRQVIRATAPRRITLRGRNPARDTILGDGHAPVFTPIYGAPNVLDHAGRRSLGSRATPSQRMGRPTMATGPLWQRAATATPWLQTCGSAKASPIP